MINLRHISLSLLALCLIACGEKTQEHDTSELLTENDHKHQFHINYNNDPNEVPFKGGLIHLQHEHVLSNAFTIQEITKFKEDIKYRAKRIPTELYLRNKGVSEEEITEALKEVESEQLFYFEFEEKQKQDLIKKYFSESLDQDIAYLSFDIFKDFKLVNSTGDTLLSNYSIYERNFHVAPYERILLSFSGISEEEELQLIYTDKLFGKGQFNFDFASTYYLENTTKNPS